MNFKVKITDVGKRRIQDTVRKSMTKREQAMFGDGYFKNIADLIVSNLILNDDAIEVK